MSTNRGPLEFRLRDDGAVVTIPFSMVEVRNENLDGNIFRLFVNETSDNIKNNFMVPFLGALYIGCFGHFLVLYVPAHLNSCGLFFSPL